MKREEFIKRAIAAGKPKEEIRKVYESIEASGGFDDQVFEPETPPEPVSRETPQQQQEPGFFDKNVVQPISGFADRLQKRSDAVYAPTALGEAAGTKPGTVADAIVGTPERATRLVLGGVGSVADAAGVPVSVGMNLANAATGGRAGKAISSVAENTGIGEFIGNVANKYKNWKGKQSPAAQANITASEAGIEALGVRGALGAPGPAVKATKGTGRALEGAAGRIQGTKVKINIPEFKKGAANKFYTKYNVFGNAKQVEKQWSAKIRDTANRLKEKINSSTADPYNYANISDIFDDAEKVLVRGKSKTEALELSKKLRSLEPIYKEAYPDGYIDVLEAQIEKQAAGKKGDWLVRNGAITANQEATTNGQLYNSIYDAIKKNIENKGAPGIKELNKQLSEMIPMERAASKQILISNRKNPISLDDYIGGLATAASAAHGNYLPAILMGTNIATKSPTVAKVLNASGKALQGKKNTIGEIAKRRR
jgi:hypothetical protein